MSVAKEVELKLSLLEPVGEKLYDLPVMGAFCPEAPLIFDIKNTYYDTEDYTLASHGMALRIREDDEGWQQTIKTQSKASADDGLHERDEYNWDLDGPELDFSKIDDPRLKSKLNQLVDPTALKPLFVTSFARSQWLLVIDDSHRLELVLDQGEISVGEHTIAIDEIEIELKSGTSVSPMYELAGSIALFMPVAPDPYSKAWRGYQLHQAVQLGRSYQPPIAKAESSEFFFQQADQLAGN